MLALAALTCLTHGDRVLAVDQAARWGELPVTFFIDLDRANRSPIVINRDDISRLTIAFEFRLAVICHSAIRDGTLN